MNPEELVRQMQFPQPSAQLNPESQVKADSRLASLWNAIKNTPRALSNAFVYNEQTQRPFPASPLYPENHDMTNAAEIANISLGMVGALTPVRSIMGAQKAVGAVDDIAQQAGKLDPLTQEARKYKSAEEFVKGQTQKLYHGTNEDFGEFRKPSYLPETQNTSSAYGVGTYLTDSLDYAKTFGKVVKEVDIPKNTKFYDLRDTKRRLTDTEAREINKAIKKLGVDLSEEGYETVSKGDLSTVIFDDIRNATDTQTLANLLKEAGYGGVKFKEIPLTTAYSSTPNRYGDKADYVVFSEDVLNKTKSQLTDIFNKAHGINNK